MALQMLLSWWNLIYLVPLAAALGYLVLYTATGVTFGRPPHQSPAAEPARVPRRVLGGLTNRTVPLSTVLSIAFLIWALVGMTANRILYGISESVSPTVLLSIPIALIATVLGTNAILRLATRRDNTPKR